MPTIEKLLGKIASIHFGLGGYQDAQLGLSVTLEGKGWGTSIFIGIWDYSHIHLQQNSTNGLKKIELMN